MSVQQQQRPLPRAQNHLTLQVFVGFTGREFVLRTEMSTDGLGPAVRQAVRGIRDMFRRDGIVTT